MDAQEKKSEFWGQAGCIFIIICVMGAIGCCVYNNHQQKKTRNIAYEKAVEATRQRVSEMVIKYGAIDDWEETLSNREIRIGKIMTYELENLWLTEKPILFIGSIEDISNLDDDYYSVQIDKSWYGSSFLLGADLQLKLKCKKEIVDGVIKMSNGAVLEWGAVAVIGKIQEIQSVTTVVDYIESVVRIGKGDCMAMEYVRFVNLKEE